MLPLTSSKRPDCASECSRFDVEICSVNNDQKSDDPIGKKSETLTNGMDAYKQFNVVVYRWLRFIGLCLGHDILREDFKPNLHTALMVTVAFSLPCFVLLTIHYIDGDLALTSGGLIGLGVKVSQ